MWKSRQNTENRTIWCGNLHSDVTDAVLFELFNQGGPVDSVRRPKDPASGRPKSFAFIVYRHESSIPYALELFKGTKLFNRALNLNSRSTVTEHVPVLDTHLSEFSRREERKADIADELKSWADFNALRGKGSLASEWQHRKDLQGPSEPKRHQEMPNPQIPDFNALLQMGQMMMLPPGGPYNAMGGMNPYMFPSSNPSTSGGWGGRENWGQGSRDDDHERRDRRRDDDHCDRRGRRRDDDHGRDSRRPTVYDRRRSQHGSSHGRDRRNR